jgi:5-(carboxyamino)imidazole ribonucleotide mutase
MNKVAIVMGSAKDQTKMQAAGDTLTRFGIEVIIAGAGKAAHLAGVMAAKSLLPVIGVPLSASLQGLDALLATVQMPTGIPVATVAVDGSANAALLAVAILALHDEELARKLAEYRDELAEQTLGQ